jgi:hypothetical protein
LPSCAKNRYRGSLSVMADKGKKHIVLIVPRGEAVRTFLYSDTIKVLSAHARVTVLSVVDDPAYVDKFKVYAERVIRLKEFTENKYVDQLRGFIHDLHFKHLGSVVAVNYQERKAQKAKKQGTYLTYLVRYGLISLFNSNAGLKLLTRIENYLSWKWRPDNYFIDLFNELKPDLVFNTSHIHGLIGELPAKIAHKMGIPVAGFVFSWDNLTSRSRITVPYDYYFVWTPGIKKDLLRIYPDFNPENVFVTGTPQFDYHFKDEFIIPKEELAEIIGFDPSRPYILYTTGIDSHFPEEHLHLEKVIQFINELDLPVRPQLIVRTYVKGTSAQMYAIRDRNLPDVIFPKVEWDEVMFTPSYSDLSIYSSLLRYADLGINVASTVTLELFIFGKPVINLGFDPVGSNIDYLMRYYRHIIFDHFHPVAQSGGTAVSMNNEELKNNIEQAFKQPSKQQAAQKAFLEKMFADTLDGKAGQRVGEWLLKLADRGRIS